ncbi:MAG: carboxypeptidase-like regulatory domain-containing protein [Bacteroidales bacterium]|jgi:hypothetical protein|nr:carboxypeptidase-like regulatory domain-containing protein [Bacteroidales bacterium]MDY0198419.1 carboxypeptidase-like regulatory domain-containing protein [Tenuifilaceae bacterium]
MRTTFLTLLLLIQTILSFAQCHVSGWVFTGTVEKPIDLPLAHMYFNSPDDSTKILYSTLTDMEGLFYLGYIPPGKYLGYAEKNGFAKVWATLAVPEGQLVWKTNFRLKRTSDKRQGIPSVNYPISQLAQSSKIADILNSLPGMKYDENTLVLSVKEGEVMIMLDDGFQLPDKIKEIQTRKIKSIDCYTIESNGRNRYAKAINILSK